ncbi:MAG: ABC transporter permease [Calditerrivibrio nitroreducens]|uniref:ABC transporter permease n=1 Tax=Calditerrivibrio nitroreducens TaxID=477976 RepID=A0A2J6WGF1_9BACT|nr:MAG: ABC transporter permease [Calditerrivibrio nitroreducens]
MNIFTIPLKNIRRKILRSCIILFIFSVGVVSLYKVSKVVSQTLEEKLNKFGADIIINPKSESLTINYGSVNLGNILYDIKYLELPPLIDKIRNIKYKNNISVIAPKLVVVKEINGKKIGVVGVNFAEELKIKNYWNINGTVPHNKDEILVGSETSMNLKLKTGDEVNLHGKLFKVSGILEKVGSEEDYLVFIDILTLQQMTALINKGNFIEISALCSGCPIDEIVAELEKVIPDVKINALQKIVKQRMSAIHFVQHLSYMVSGVILITSCFMIALFIFNSVNERKKEIGILRSMGYSSGDIFIIFSFEGVLIGFLSGLVGYLLSLMVSNSVLKYLHVENINFSFNLLEMLFVVIAMVLLSLISASYPSYKASTIEPADTIVSL